MCPDPQRHLSPGTGSPCWRPCSWAQLAGPQGAHGAGDPGAQLSPGLPPRTLTLSRPCAVSRLDGRESTHSALSRKKASSRLQGGQGLCSAGRSLGTRICLGAWEGLPTHLGFPGGSPGKEPTCSAGDLGLIPGLGRSPGEGKGHPLQYSGLETSMDCIVYGVTKSRTRLSDFHWEGHARTGDG